MRLRIATLNILGTADRWEERRPLLVEGIAELGPDVLGLQEVEFSADQDELLASAMAPDSTVQRATEHGTFGNSLVVGPVLRGAWNGPPRGTELALPGDRAAAIVDVPLDDGPLRLVTTHLHWVPEEQELRLEQLMRLVEHLAALEPAAATVLTGDLNATPDEPAITLLRTAGFSSAFAAIHGADPEWTYPSPMTPADVAVRPPSPIDYVWVLGSAQVVDASTALDRPSPHDPSLYPSDHRAVVADLEVP
ncbi:MAG TPA: endonuclease/exonuclease/phosphatase family protein [Candidatus Limnocylindria bacterium]|nr:endonuclease/exonuclease/phosphatase family protein [Candidatus Limnocylindria bacterium]